MTGLQLYLLITPFVLMALAWGTVLWIRHSIERSDRKEPGQQKLG